MKHDEWKRVLILLAHASCDAVLGVNILQYSRFGSVIGYSELCHERAYYMMPPREILNKALRSQDRFYP